MGSKLEQSAHCMSYIEVKKQLQDGVATAPRHRGRRRQHPPAGQSSTSQSHWELDTVNSSPTSTDWKFPIQMYVHVAQVLKPPTASCSPAPLSRLWDSRRGPVRWMPTGSFGDWLRHCGRQRASPYRTENLAWPGMKDKFSLWNWEKGTSCLVLFFFFFFPQHWLFFFPLNNLCFISSLVLMNLYHYIILL